MRWGMTDATRNLRPLKVLRYTNRKLYAVNTGYIALRDVRQAVFNGRSVHVT
ncbi:MAG: hypothetical protein EOO63_06550 [Hymenobacter sp.]|nr:MAG: hypothetical protein EOO63_06550 [Hymenobacter sp.]